jgi:hypothetical protein
MSFADAVIPRTEKLVPMTLAETQGCPTLVVEPTVFKLNMMTDVASMPGTATTTAVVPFNVSVP